VGSQSAADEVDVDEVFSFSEPRLQPHPPLNYCSLAKEAFSVVRAPCTNGGIVYLFSYHNGWRSAIVVDGYHTSLHAAILVNDFHNSLGATIVVDSYHNGLHAVILARQNTSQQLS